MMYLPIVFATEAEDNIGEEVHASFMYRFDPVSAQPAFHLYFHVYTSLAVSHRFQFVLPSKALASQPNRFRVIGGVIKQGGRAGKSYEKSCTQIAGTWKPGTIPSWPLVIAPAR